MEEIRLQGLGDPFPVVGFRVSMPDGIPTRLVCWEVAATSHRPARPSKIHVATPGILAAAEGDLMTWCGRPVPGKHDVAVSAAAGGDLCKPCLSRLAGPYVPWLRPEGRSQA